MPRRSSLHVLNNKATREVFVMSSDGVVAQVLTYSSDETMRLANLFAASETMLKALEAIESHHVALNHMAGRDESRSFTLKLAREAISEAFGNPHLTEVE